MKIFKSAVFVAFAISNLAGAATASHNLRVSVPFAFVVAGEHFKPGNYEVTESQNGVITVQGEGKAAAVLSIPGQSPSATEVSMVSFKNSHSQPYLSGVVVEGESRLVPVTTYQARTLRIATR